MQLASLYKAYLVQYHYISVYNLTFKNFNQVNNFDLTMYEYQVIRLKLTLIFCHQNENMAVKSLTDVELAAVSTNVDY